ncbi:MAG TPA: PIN domain-containing protein [Segetibacter sp.]
MTLKLTGGTATRQDYRNQIMRTVVIDSNIVFSALLAKNASIRDKLYSNNFKFYSPKFLFVEIFKHKERILKISNASEDDILELLSIVLHPINFINEAFISTAIYINEFSFCQDVDEKDTSFIAMAIALDCEVWTRDEVLKTHR